MFGIFGSLFGSPKTSTVKVEPWDGAKPYLYGVNRHLEIAEDVRRAVKQSRFHSLRDGRVDAEHWATLDADIEVYTLADNKAGVTYAAYARLPLNAFTAKAHFLIHMLDAFADGDRFIVAKLAYDGGTV